MRVLVYKEPGVNYLTRTEGLRPVLIGRSGVVLVDLPVMYAYGANRETPRVRGVVNLKSLEAPNTGRKTGIVVYVSWPAEAT
jgi:hypothetical protein